MVRAGVLAIAFIALLSTASAAAADALRKWTVGSWEVSEHEAFCMGASPSLMTGNTSLMFAMNTADELIALVGNQSWQMRGKRVKEVFVSIDRDYLGGFPTVAISPDVVAVKLPTHLIPGLQDGVRITMQFDRASYTFPLRHTRFGLEVLAKCAREKAGKGSGALAAETAPQRSATKSTSGTGFFLSRDGLVLTNAHVVNDCASIRVTDSEGAVVPATMAFSDKVNDLALLRTRIVPREIAALRNAPVQRGEEVAAFGYPLASVLSSGGSFTKGDVSATEGMKDDTRHMQISIPVQPGNSGGPVVDYYGNVVGVVRHKLDAMMVAAVSGDIPQNVNFAIKVSAVRGFLESKGITTTEGHVGGQELKPTELADKAKSMSVFIRCEAGPS